MPLEHSNGDERLLTTDEAERLIALYAEREQARRAEAERIAAMPKLSDVAILVGTSVEELRPLLAQLRGSLPSDTNVPDGEMRLSQFEADRLVEIYGRTERERQAELERRAQMASLDDIAEGLSIPVEEAADLLKEVRRRREQAAEPFTDLLLDDIRQKREQQPGEVGDVPPVLFLPTPPEEETADETVDEFGRTYTDAENRTATITAIGVLIALVLIIAVIAAAASGPSRTHTNSYPSYSHSSGYNSYPTSRPRPEYAVDSWGSYSATYQSLSGPNAPATIHRRFDAPPKGWTVRVYGPNGVAVLPSSSVAAADKAEEIQRLSKAVQSFAWSTPATRNSPPLELSYSLIPFAPAAKPKSSTDIAGTSILEVQKGGVSRRVYLVVPTDGTTASDDAVFQQRLDYLAGGGPSATGFLGYEEVRDPACKPPPGVTVTVFAYGRGYRAVGAAAPQTIDSARWTQRTEKSAAALVAHAYAKNAKTDVVSTPAGEKFAVVHTAGGKLKLVPFQTVVSVSSVGGTTGTNVYGYAEALQSRDHAKLAGSLVPMKAVAVDAVVKLEKTVNSPSGGF